MSILDPVIVSIVQDMFKELALNEACMMPLQQRLLPTLVSILQAGPDKVALGLPSVSKHVEHQLFTQAMRLKNFFHAQLS